MTALTPWLSRCLALAVLLVSRAAVAQFGPMGGGMGPPPTQQAQPKPKANEPQTHAASGASDELAPLPTTEPAIPADPLAVDPSPRSHS